MLRVLISIHKDETFSFDESCLRFLRDIVVSLLLSKGRNETEGNDDGNKEKKIERERINRGRDSPGARCGSSVFLFLPSPYSWDMIGVLLLSVSLIVYRVLAKRMKESRLGC